VPMVAIGSLLGLEPRAIAASMAIVRPGATAAAALGPAAQRRTETGGFLVSRGMTEGQGKKVVGLRCG
jgi:hypothetical protein